MLLLITAARYSVGFIMFREGAEEYSKKFSISFPAQEQLAALNDGRDRSGSYAIVRISGIPRWVEQGRFYHIFRVHQREGKDIYLTRVNFYQSPHGWYIRGEPYLDNIRVVATVERHFRGSKVRTIKFRSKKHYKRIYGFRPEMTQIRIKDIQVYPSYEFNGDWKSDDPMTFILNRVRQLRCPSTLLAKMKMNALKHFTSNELALLGPDPLSHFDPVYNKVVIRHHVAHS